MYHFTGRLSLCLVLVANGTALAQSLPTSQPNVLQIFREEVKVGHDAEHVKTEIGWPAAWEKANLPYYSIALVTLTGPPEAWFVTPFESQAAMGDWYKRLAEPALAPEMARLQRADAEHISNVRGIIAVGRKDLSRGAFPDAGKQRFYEIITFRVRPGREGDFEAAAKAYGAAAGRAAPNAAYRVYQVIAGMPTPTYFVFSSVVSFGEFDKMMTDGDTTMKGLTADERTTIQKFSTEAVLSNETQRFRLDPEMSYVPKEVRSQDPDFWTPKKPAAKKATSQPQQ